MLPKIKSLNGAVSSKPLWNLEIVVSAVRFLGLKAKL